LIAKEGRKYGLNICLATQRPREGVLSQMGTMIVHRIINDRDREVSKELVEKLIEQYQRFYQTLNQEKQLLLVRIFQFH
jgi:hypothetical protein